MSSRLTKPARRVVTVLVFALVVHLFVLPQIGGARKALSVVGSVDPVLVVLAVALEGLSILAYARLTQLLVSTEHRPGLGVTFGTVMASTGVNHVVPGGAATTAAVSSRLLVRAGVPPTELGFALGAQALGSAVVLNILLWLALVISIPTSGFHPLYGTAAAAGALLIGGFSAAVIAMLRGSDQFADRVARLLGRLPEIRPEQVRATALRVAEQLSILARDPARLRTVLVLAAANWLLDAAVLWITLAAFGHPPGIVGLLVAYGLANVIAAIPVSPGGLGVIEAVLIPTLIAFGTPRAEASIGVVAYRLINFWLPIPVGAVSYVAVERHNNKKQQRSFRDEINRQVNEQLTDPPAGSGPAEP